MNTGFDRTDLIVSAHDPDGQTFRLAADLHPRQGRILEYVLRDERFPFRQCTDVVRWCVCFGLYTLLVPLPHPLALMEAKMNILQDENFERQKDCLSVSVQKYLAVGNVEGARRLVVQSHEEYRKISNEYWRTKWLSTLESAIETLGQQGIQLSLDEKPNVRKN
jgi:hypothetical protein